METTRVKVSDLEVGDQILVGYKTNTHTGVVEAHLFAAKTTGRERWFWGYATGTISKIERVRKDTQWNAGKFLMLTIDGVPSKHMFIKWAKASVVTY
jgi:hypothetical protein